MRTENIHYPSRTFISNLNNTLLLNKIEPLTRDLKSELKAFRNGETFGITMQQADMLTYLDKIPNIDTMIDNMEVLQAMEMQYNSL